VAAPSPRARLGRRTVRGRTEQRRPPVLKRYETKVKMVWGSVFIAAAALKTPTRNGYNAQGGILTSLSHCTGGPVSVNRRHDRRERFTLLVANASSLHPLSCIRLLLIDVFSWVKGSG